MLNKMFSGVCAVTLLAVVAAGCTQSRSSDRTGGIDQGTGTTPSASPTPSTGTPGSGTGTTGNTGSTPGTTSGGSSGTSGSSGSTGGSGGSR